MRASQPGIVAETGTLLRNAWRQLRRGGARLAGLILASQLLLLLVALPVVSWLFREALRANGMSGLDLGRLPMGTGFPLTITLILVIVAISFWLIVLQFTALVVLLRWPRLTAREFLGQLGRVARALASPRALPLVGYLFVLLPLSGFGFTSVLTRGIAIPSFVSGELLKSPASAIGFGVFLLILAWLNVRFALTIPLFVLTTGRRSLRTSWRLTRGPRTWVPLVLATAGILAIAALAGALLALIALLPTALADALAPAAAPGVAAAMLGLAQVGGMLLSGGVTAAVAGVLITRVRQRADRLPAEVAFVPSPEATAAAGSAAVGAGSGAAAVVAGSVAGAAIPRGGPRRPATLVTAAALVIAVGCGVAGWGTLQRLAAAPDTLVLAHRGFSEGGVENTLSGLDAADAAGADLVEMDVMQTRDGKFVAMHDAKLDRLAGRPEAVKDLTLAELTKVTVRDQRGNEDTIPTFADYVRHAQRLEMPLLIEIKLGGADTPDHVDRLIDELESLDALDQNMYHSLDVASVERLKQLRPDLTVGYTMAFAGGGVPETVADFIVVEEWTATVAMQDAARAAGLGFMAWTVNDESGFREHLRRSSDGIITDRPDLVLAARDEIQEESGVAETLLDALTRFVTLN